MKTPEIIKEIRELSETPEFSEYLKEKTKGKSRQYKYYYKNYLLRVPAKALQWLVEWEEIKRMGVKKNT